MVVIVWFFSVNGVLGSEDLSFSLTIGGEIRQSSNTSQMIMDLRQQISWASQFYTLHPGDIIMTGTPEGVGPVEPGDEMYAEIDDLGAMRVAVRAF